MVDNMAEIEVFGFNARINRNVLDDFELVEALRNAEENELLFVDVLKRVLGEEQYKAVKEHVRNEHGIVSSEKMGEFLRVLLENVGELKN